MLVTGLKKKKKKEKRNDTVYCSISWLIAVGIGIGESKEDNRLDFATGIVIISAPLLVPIYLGYVLSKIK